VFQYFFIGALTIFVWISFTLFVFQTILLGFLLVFFYISIGSIMIFIGFPVISIGSPGICRFVSRISICSSRTSLGFPGIQVVL
jgi:hypothetical protein